ncbi:hypothetical protein CXB51_034101 [Gossypium anomalum]|uniref:Peptidase C1A papain C-terminal domain-containing protein n=1 Tax=Gossypium anomalum TaxID=47600 RepID=A0A8J5XQ66_9ROSI|nr:hypothetical protein CXB51_034101 [Gossypium anomalum]
MYLGIKSNRKTQPHMLTGKNKSRRYTFKIGRRKVSSSHKIRANVELLGFLTVAAVEGISKIVTDDLISLSEQELVDCDTLYNEGCNGGLMDSAFEFFIKNGGIDTEEDYPYRASENLHIFQLQMRHFYAGVSWCSSFRLKNGRLVSIDGYEDVPENDENSLKKAVANRSVVLALKLGVFSGDCKTDLDHGVVIVGYGTENGVDYWRVRNSWGSNWGENGYIRMEINVVGHSNGKCGIAMMASYPIKKG